MSLRVYGRTWSGLGTPGQFSGTPGQGTPTWNMVTTDPFGSNEYVYLTWLVQVIQLNLGESPFYADWGIPAVQSVIQQIFPDFYMSVIQQKFQQYFASLIISRVPNTVQPTYNVNVMLYNGTSFQATISL
jgi:hypothetical protein